MSRNIKILTAVLALIALLSARYLFAALGLRTPESQQTANSGAALLGGNESDTDKDGLNLREETYWRTNQNDPDSDDDGFLDGEEVASGHHPLIKGPDDWLDRGRNLTNRTMELALGGVLAGDLDVTSANYDESVQALADAMANQYRKNAAIELDPLTIVDSTIETREQYLQQMATELNEVFLPSHREVSAILTSLEGIPLEDPLVLTKDTKRYAKFVSESRRLATLLGERAKRLAAVPVPRNLVTEHRAGVHLLRHLQANLTLAATLKEDVLQGTAAIRVLIKLQLDAMPRFMQAFARAMQTKLND